MDTPRASHRPLLSDGTLLALLLAAVIGGIAAVLLLMPPRVSAASPATASPSVVAGESSAPGLPAVSDASAPAADSVQRVATSAPAPGRGDGNPASSAPWRLDISADSGTWDAESYRAGLLVGLALGHRDGVVRGALLYRESGEVREGALVRVVETPCGTVPVTALPVRDGAPIDAAGACVVGWGL